MVAALYIFDVFDVPVPGSCAALCRVTCLHRDQLDSDSAVTGGGCEEEQGSCNRIVYYDCRTAGMKWLVIHHPCCSSRPRCSGLAGKILQRKERKSSEILQLGFTRSAL